MFLSQALIVLLSVFIFGSCQLLPKKPSQFKVRNIWTRSSSSSSLVQPRLMNRSTPQVYKKNEQETFLIWGNPYQGIQAIHSQSGQLRWRYDLKNGTEARIALAGDYVFVAANDGFIYAIEAGEGRLLWSFPTRSENNTEIVVHQGLVYIVSSQNTLFALEALTGKRVWLYTRPASNHFNVRGGSRPLVYQDQLYVAFGDGVVAAFKAATGQLVWEKELIEDQRFKDLDTDLAIYKDSLIVGGFEDAVYRLKLSTGNLIWKSEQGSFGSFAIQDEYICYASTQFSIECLQGDEGKSVYSFKNTSKSLKGSPVFWKNKLVFGDTQGPIYFLDFELQKIIGHFDTGRGVLAAPVISEDLSRLYVISNESNLFALEADWLYP